MGARAFDDGPYFRGLRTSLDFAAFPCQREGRLRYCASNQVGDAVLFYAAVRALPGTKCGTDPLEAANDRSCRKPDTLDFSSAAGITPGGFLWLAAALVLVYLVCDGLGWREYTSVLSGTVEPGDQGGRFLAPGLIYVAAYLGFVVAAPLLALAACLSSAGILAR